MPRTNTVSSGQFQVRPLSKKEKLVRRKAEKAAKRQRRQDKAEKARRKAAKGIKGERQKREAHVPPESHEISDEDPEGQAGQEEEVLG